MSVSRNMDLIAQRCHKCLLLKVAAEFNRNRTYSDGHLTQCKACESQYKKEWYRRPGTKEKKQAYDKRRLAEPGRREHNALYQKRYRYGLTPEQYERMHVVQEGKCAACKEKHRLVVDHCHSTGKVRGLLCGRCNAALGLLRESPDFARNLAEYISREAAS